MPFGYDDLARQTSDERLSSNVAYNVQRSYDANGLNQYTRAGGVTTAYDGRGNLTRAAARTFGYDGDNQLTGANGAPFGYNPVGQLARVPDDGGTRFAYAGDMIAAEYDDAGALRRRYVPGDGANEVLLQYEGAGYGGRRYYASDERGSVIEVSDQSGATLAINTYDDHGIPAAGNLGRFGYTGQAWLPAAQAWYYHARVYDPLLGRFMQIDPIGYGDGLNWYNYTGGDPVNKTDPSGKFGLFGGCPAGSHCTSTNPDASNRDAEASRLQREGYSASDANAIADYLIRYGSYQAAAQGLRVERILRNPGLDNLPQNGVQQVSLLGNLSVGFQNLQEFVSNAADFRTVGLAGEAAVRGDILRMNLGIAGEQLYIRIDDGRVRITDFLATDYHGNFGGIEAKANTSTRSSRQLEIDNIIATAGGTIISRGPLGFGLSYGQRIRYQTVGVGVTVVRGLPF